ncbi:MAG: hypothetical protein HDR30_02460 [Lachnospiraceae bacterium]|nr:hypothetical protein [Lachnospiraceae bacterium]
MSIFEYDEERELALLRKDEYNSGVKAGMEMGRATGIKIGKEFGIKESTENIVLRMLSAGTYKLEEIAHISGMDIEAVEKLKIKLPI